MSKNLLAHDTFPQTPTAHPPSSLHSTPSTTLSPSLTPFTTPTASPHPATIAAFLAQAGSSLQHSPQPGSPLSVGHPSPIQPTPHLLPSMSRVLSPANPVSGISSPQGATSLLHSKHSLSMAAKQTTNSSGAATKQLSKSSFASAAESTGNNLQSNSVQSSVVASKSPSAKFVTVSILQQLQHNPNITKLLSAAAAHQSNGSGTSDR